MINLRNSERESFLFKHRDNLLKSLRILCSKPLSDEWLDLSASHDLDKQSDQNALEIKLLLGRHASTIDEWISD